MTRSESVNYACPTCGRPVSIETEADRALVPFCSERCKLIDLGKWFNEEYRISRDLQPEELLDADARPPEEPPR